MNRSRYAPRMSMEPIDAAAEMRAIDWDTRDRLIEAGKPVVVDARHLWLTGAVIPLPPTGGAAA